SHMVQEGIDQLVLGCTHYPYLIPLLKELLPSNVKIIDSGDGVARQTKKVLEEFNLRCPEGSHGEFQFYTNREVKVLESFIKDAGVPYKVSFLDF
ncbi:MAG: glutamate racemase, partial [Arenibacter sp.]|nr:glutamate racemase [Arenibacter sp.]